MSRPHLLFRRLLAAILLTVPAGLGNAHHGFDGRYDLSAPVWLQGTVRSSYFGPPHSEFTLMIGNPRSVPAGLDLGPAAGFIDASDLVLPAAAPGDVLSIELPPTSQYSGLGGRMRDGDVIAAVALRNCSPPHQFNVQWLRLSDGSVESRRAAMSYMVAGC